MRGRVCGERACGAWSAAILDLACRYFRLFTCLSASRLLIEQNLPSKQPIMIQLIIAIQIFEAVPD